MIAKSTRLRGLLVQLVVIIILPTLVALMLVAYGGVALHEHSMRTLVAERDARAVQATAESFSARFIERQVLLTAIANRLQSGLSLDAVLAEQPQLRAMFDQGIVVSTQETDSQGWFPNEAWSITQPGISWLHVHNAANPYIVTQATSSDQQIMAAGASSLANLGFFNALETAATSQTQLFWLAQDGHVLAASNPQYIGRAAAEVPNLHLLTHDQDMTTHQNDDVLLVSYPVATIGGMLVLQEQWSTVIDVPLRWSLAAPLAMIPAVFLAMGVLVFGTWRILIPLQRLRYAANRTEWGSYDAVKQSVGGVQEIRELHSALARMAGRLKAAQTAMQGYVGAVLRGQEDERRRIARELHDDTLQALIVINQQRQKVTRSIERDPSRITEHLDTLHTLIDETSTNLRRLIRDMRPSYLDDLGLVPALEMLCAHLPASSTCIVANVVEGSAQRLSDDVELALYRIAQEALANVMRHGQAKHMTVRTVFSETIPNATVTLTIHDDGCGFTVPTHPDAFAAAGHYGLMGMVERAEVVGADFSIDSGTGKGTRIRVCVPLVKAIRQTAY